MRDTLLVCGKLVEVGDCKGVRSEMRSAHKARGRRNEDVGPGKAHTFAGS